MAHIVLTSTNGNPLTSSPGLHTFVYTLLSSLWNNSTQKPFLEVSQQAVVTECWFY